MMEIEDEDDFYAPEEPKVTPAEDKDKDKAPQKADDDLEEGEEEDEGAAMDEDDDESDDDDSVRRLSHLRRSQPASKWLS